jgi:DNA-binding response OmpR family regulator
MFLAGTLAARPGRGMIDKLRIVIALPDPHEAAMVADWLLMDGYDPVPRWTTSSAADEMRARPFDLLIADSNFVYRDRLFTKGRARNARTPTVVIGNADTVPPTEVAGAQTMVLTRPIERAILVCYISMALLDGRPMRRSPRKAVLRLDAFVAGLPTRIIDVSHEGVRLEVPDKRRLTLPALFQMRVLHADVAVTVQTIWTRPSPGRDTMTWLGGALSLNRPAAAQAWRSFVDSVPLVGESNPVATAGPLPLPHWS